MYVGTSMLVKDDEDEICWWDVDDGFRRFQINT